MKESIGDRIFGMANVLLLVVIGIITLFPLYYVFVVSFTEPSEYIEKYGFVLFPSKWSVGAYEYLLSTSAFIRATGVSAFLATVGTMLSLIVTSAFAFGLSRKRLRGRKAMMIMVMFTILLIRELSLPIYWSAI